MGNPVEDTTKDPAEKFRTPSCILIPALVERCDNWNEKTQQRNREPKSADPQS